MKLLFIKRCLAWPRATGHDVYTYHLMQALSERGAEVSLATTEPLAPEACEGLQLPIERRHVVTALPGAPSSGEPTLTALQRRLAGYFGIPLPTIGAMCALCDTLRPDAVIITDLNLLPCVAGIEGPVRVWYAADELTLAMLSQVRVRAVRSWTNILHAPVMMAYERAYASGVDRAWGVSDTERTAFRWLGGVRRTDVVQLGVDTETFRPGLAGEVPFSAVFWGRLDFEPNVQALRWFCERVWSQLSIDVPEATFTIVGAHPNNVVRGLSRIPGVTLISDLPDLRHTVSRSSVAVLPMITGAGSKNKLLEAAALGMAVVCTPRACAGLDLDDAMPLVLAQGAKQWVAALKEIWGSTDRRRQLGAAARQWVVANHTWDVSAKIALDSIEAALAERRRAASSRLCDASVAR